MIYATDSSKVGHERAPLLKESVSLHSLEEAVASTIRPQQTTGPLKGEQFQHRRALSQTHYFKSWGEMFATCPFIGGALILRGV